MKTHELNLPEEDYTPVAKGYLKAIITKNDTDARDGDMLLLKEYFPLVDRHSGKTLAALVTHVYKGPAINPDYCLLSFRLLK